jgi:biopolymer transport protein TolR
MTRLPKSAGPICRIDVTGFLSVQLALLFAFIGVIAGRPDLPRNAVDLSKANHAVEMRGADREDALIVAIQRDGDVWLGNERLSLDQLPIKVRKAISNGSEKKIYIRADARAKYSDVLKVLRTMRATGVEDVAFLTDRRLLPAAGR